MVSVSAPESSLPVKLKSVVDKVNVPFPDQPAKFLRPSLATRTELKSFNEAGENGERVSIVPVANSSSQSPCAEALPVKLEEAATSTLA